MYKFPNKHSDTVSIKQQFKYFIPGYVTVSHCETFAVYGKNTGEWEGKIVSVLCPPKALGWAILHGKSQQYNGREKK